MSKNITIFIIIGVLLFLFIKKKKKLNQQITLPDNQQITLPNNQQFKPLNEMTHAELVKELLTWQEMRNPTIPQSLIWIQAISRLKDTILIKELEKFRKINRIQAL